MRLTSLSLCTAQPSLEQKHVSKPTYLDSTRGDNRQIVDTVHFQGKKVPVGTSRISGFKGVSIYGNGTDTEAEKELNSGKSRNGKALKKLRDRRRLMNPQEKLKEQNRHRQYNKVRREQVEAIGSTVAANLEKNHN